MYQTVDRRKKDVAPKSLNRPGSSYSDKLSLRSSWAPIIWKRSELKAMGSGSETTLHSVQGVTDCCITFLVVMIALALIFVIVLWIMALIADGPDETHICATIWPVVAGVLAIAISFFVLKVVELCLKKRLRKKNIEEQKSTIDESKDSGNYSLRLDITRRSDPEPTSILLEYKQHPCIGGCYLFLTFSLLVIMTVSVVQYFSLSAACYHHMEHNIDELLLGYQVLAYLSVVVLSIFGFILSCFVLAVVIHHCSANPSESA